jgi:hypothetical protein
MIGRNKHELIALITLSCTTYESFLPESEEVCAFLNCNKQSSVKARRANYAQAAGCMPRNISSDGCVIVLGESGMIHGGICRGNDCG